CDHAFEAGFEVRNLLDAGQTAPSLGVVLRDDDPAALAALRLLWSQRPTRPWDRCGPVRTAFDLARDPEAASVLGRSFDVLLYQEEPAWPLRHAGQQELRPASILLCTDRLVLQGVPFTGIPRRVEILVRPDGSE